SWTVGDGPVLRNSIYLGEVHDARREQAGWDEAGFDDTSWKPADIAGGDVGPLRRSPAPPVRVMGTLSPVAIAQPRPGVYVFDLGENFTGWARLRTRGSAGTRIMMRFGELLYPDGSLNAMTSICGQIKRGGKDYVYPGEGEPLTAFQSDTYVLRGAKEDEVYTPRFTFHAFRYVEVTGLPHAPKPDTIQGLRLHADVKPVGSFSCSNDLFNRIEAMTRRTMLSNLISVQSDCPHRERFGYGGDIVVMAETFLLHFDMAGFYAKAVEDLADAARENGGMTETAPYVGIADESLGSGAGPVGWGTAFPMLQWHLYQYHGNVELLREHYDATRRWVDLLASAAGPGLVLDNGIGDHESVVEKPPKALTGTAFFFLNATLFSRIARSLGRADDATRYADLAARIRTAFNARFLQAGTGRYGPASQASQAFALFLDLVPPDEKQRAFDVLLADIDARDGHLSTGIFGTRFLLLALSALGRADVAFHIANKTTYPSWGHMLERGATTLW
ncbi:MAG: family 78 glycoside hydrolase catalytic domain, partial [Tepidisphaeraceae bacterium]